MTTAPDNGNPSDGNGGGALESRSGEKGFAASMKKRVSTLIASSGTQIPEDELAQLLAETNFTEREIKGFYKYSSSETLSRPEFAKLCIDQGMTNSALIERMWKVFDADSSGGITHYELVKGLNPMLRGTRKDVAGMFFDIYEIDGDGQVSVDEIISVYSDMVFISEEEYFQNFVTL